jgi:hypothetical protein
MIEATAFRTFIRIHSLFRSEHLSANIILTFHRALIQSVMTFLLRLGFSGRHLPLKTAALAKQASPHQWKFSKVHIGPRLAQGFQHSVYIRLYNRIVQATNRSHKNHENEHVRGTGQGEARYRQYKRLKLGGGHAYDNSSD